MVHFHTRGATDDAFAPVSLPDGFFEACRDVPHPPRFAAALVLGAAGATWGGELQALVVACSIIPLVGTKFRRRHAILTQPVFSAARLAAGIFSLLAVSLPR